MPRYIGKANDPEKRLHTHLRDAKRRHGPIQKWICELMDEGKRPGMQVLVDGLTQDNWKSVEKATIEAARDILGRDYILNLASGGNEPPNTKTAEQKRQTALKVVAARTSNPRAAKFYKAKHAIGQLLSRNQLTREAKDRILVTVLKHPELFPKSWPEQLRQ